MIATRTNFDRRLGIALFALLGLLALSLTVANFTSRAAAAELVESARPGRWSDPGTWRSGSVPKSGDSIVISHDVTFDAADTTVSGLRVAPNGRLAFAGDKSATLNSSKNVVVEGVLTMRPASAAINHTLRFINVNESAMVGGGMDVLDSDVGLWVMGDGQLDAVGSQKTGWTRASGSIAAGSRSVALESSPIGWQAGDEVTIAPTDAPTAGAASYDGFDESKIGSISGSSLQLGDGVDRAHPKVNDAWGAEVANLTRNVRIEGTPSGNTHTFIRSNAPQTIQYVGFRYVGVPRGETFGRYGLHFHHSYAGSRRTVVEGVVVRDGGNHAFVPHESHGITFRDTVSYNTREDAYWWDIGTDSDDIEYDHAMAAKVLTGADQRGFTLAGFNLGSGQGNVQRNSVAVGVQGLDNASGFKWPEGGNGDWLFEEGNVSHNNKRMGYWGWQNTSKRHVIGDFVAYYNGGFGLAHGAYENMYHFRDIALYGNGQAGIRLEAKARWGHAPLLFENIDIDGAGISEDGILIAHHNSEKDFPAKLRNITIRNYKGYGVHVAEEGESKPGYYDFSYSDLGPKPFWFENSVRAETQIRWQPNDSTAMVLRQKDQAGTAVGEWNAKRSDTAPFATRDTTAPTGVTLNVTNGQTLSGAIYPQVNGRDDTGVVAADFVVDDDIQLNDTTAPYTFNHFWNGEGFEPGVHRVRGQVWDAQGNVGEGQTFCVIVRGDSDSQVPSTPRAVAAVLRPGGTQVTWWTSFDDTALAGYRIYRNGSVVGTVYADENTEFTDSSSSSTATYQVRSFDAAGKESPLSVAVTPTTGSTPTTPTTPPTTVPGTTTTTSPSTTTAAPGQTTTTQPSTTTTAPRQTTTTQPTTTTTAPGGSGTGSQGPVLAFNFDEAKGTTASDRSGSGNNGAVANGTWTSGKNGGALSFNGTSSVVTVADSPKLDLTGAMTIEAWINPTSAMAQSWRTVVLKERPGGLAYAMYASTDNGRPSGEVFNGGTVDSRGTSSVERMKWTHLAVTYDGTNLRTYVDGRLVSTSRTNKPIVTSGGVLRIGGNAVWGEYFAGKIDDVRVYSRALSALEVNADMAKPVS